MVSHPAVNRPRRTHSRALRWTVIVVVVVLALLLVADRGGEYVAENLAASKLQSSQNLPNKPDVEISGFPFLTQFASGHYDEVTVTSSNIPIGSGDTRISLSSVKVVLDDMTVSDNFTDVHVDRASAVGVVSYSELSNALGVSLSYAGDGKVKASKKITLFGQTITPTITAAPQFTSGGLAFVASAANGLSGSPLGQVAKLVFGDAIPLDGIPFDVKVNKLSMTADGLRIDLSGADITYKS